MIPLSILIGAATTFVLLTEKKEGFRMLFVAIELDISLLFCVFNYYNLSIAILLSVLILSTTCVSAYNASIEKNFNALLRLFFEICKLISSIVICISFDSSFNEFQKILFFLPFILALIFDYTININLESFTPTMFLTQKSMQVFIIFLANFQSYSELVTAYTTFLIIDLIFEVIFTEKFSKRMIKNFFLLILNWNTMDLARLFLCIL